MAAAWIEGISDHSPRYLKGFIEGMDAVFRGFVSHYQACGGGVYDGDESADEYLKQLRQLQERTDRDYIAGCIEGAETALSRVHGPVLPTEFGMGV